MQTTWRDLITMVHGMLFGGFFLMASFGAAAFLLRSRGGGASPESLAAARAWDRAYLIATVLLGWAAVLSGAFVVYPWYRALLPPGAADLAGYPQRLLLASPQTSGWHSIGMEWKEHVAWFAPMLMTAAAFILLRFRGDAAEERRLRQAVAWLAIAAFLAAGIAAGFGALINKHAPVTGGPVIRLTGGGS